MSGYVRFFCDIVKLEKVKEFNNSNVLVNLLIFMIADIKALPSGGAFVLAKYLR